MMVVLISRAGYCTISTRYDRAAIADADLWARCLLAGFDEVLALGGDGRASPASFTIDAQEPTPVSSNGSAAQ
jgi:diacylglycerol O-acyltransferase